MKHEVNAMGKQCPIPVVMTKKVIDNAAVGDEIEILIDNETAVNNLSRLANKTGCTFVSEKLGDKKYQVKMAVKTEQTGGTLEEEEFVCEAPHKKVTVAVISSNVMGNGDDELGKILIKGFIYALSQMETHPDTILFYNGGAKLTTEDSESLEDLKKMEEEGVEILTCGTCLKHYGLMEKLMVGKVTDMYTIAERMTGADKVIRLQPNLCTFSLKKADDRIDRCRFTCTGASCKNKESMIRCFSDCFLLHFIQNSSCLFLDQLNSVPDKLFILRTHNIQFIKHPGSVQFQIIILCRINDSFSAFFFQHQLPVNNHIHKMFLHIGFIYSQKSGTSCK